MVNIAESARGPDPGPVVGASSWPRIEPQRRRWLDVAEAWGTWRWTAIGVGLVVLLGSIDATLSTEISFAFFYLIPVALVAWFGGRRSGLAISVLSAVTWLLAEHLAGIAWTHPLINAWNTVSRFGFFVVVTLLLTALRAALREATTRARRDHLTGAINGRWLAELTEQEIYRAGRYGHAFSFAYIDLDGFKAVNDALGHARGDELLCDVVRSIGARLRRTDLLARVGGDEFVCVLPETGERAACEVMDRIRAALADDMRRQGLAVTMSIGIVTAADPALGFDQIMRRADELMYTVKHGRKNGIASATLGAMPSVAP